MIWNNSFNADGTTKEIVGLGISHNRYLILDGSSNTSHSSQVNLVKLQNHAGAYILNPYTQNYEQVFLHIHSHPNLDRMNDRGIGISPEDIAAYNTFRKLGINMQIIYNGKIYDFFGENQYNYRATGVIVD